MEVRRINPTTSELYHHGIKGQKWGVRRFQNPDGTLTEEGRKRFSNEKNLNRQMQIQNKNYEKMRKKGVGMRDAIDIHNRTARKMEANDIYNKISAKYKNVDFTKSENKKLHQKYHEDLGKEWSKLFKESAYDKYDYSLSLIDKNKIDELMEVTPFYTNFVYHEEDWNYDDKK